MNTGNDENLKTVLTLLDKAEQILSILNLSETTIGKYNQLKELAFDKLGIDFYPLVNKGRKPKSQGSDVNSLLVDKLKFISAQKSVIIDFLFDLIEKMKFEDNSYMKQYLFENNLMKELEFNLNNVAKNFSKNSDEFEFELKLEDIKIKDFICKTDIYYKNFVNSLSKNDYKKGSNLNFENNNSLEEIIHDYNIRVDEIKAHYENEFEIYKERFNELRIKYNPEIENELFAVRNELQERNFLIDKINEMTVGVYDEHFEKNLNWYESVAEEFKYKEMEYVHFLACLVDKFFNDNKYLIEMVSNLQKENNLLLDDRNLPFVANAIHKNNILTQICEDSKIVDENVKNFHKSFEEVIDFINKNLENFN
jgi:hypothetical protein